jgi:hypothetical protein
VKALEHNRLLFHRASLENLPWRPIFSPFSSPTGQLHSGRLSDYFKRKMSAPITETQPLLGSKRFESTEHSGPIAGHSYSNAKNANDTTVEPCVVDFDPYGDVDNPLEWPTAFKWGIVLLLAVTAFTVYVRPFSSSPCHLSTPQL